VHLYVKRKTAGQEIDHNEDVTENDRESRNENEKEKTNNLLLFDHESKV